MDNLFPSTESLSPRLQWMRLYGITTEDKNIFQRKYWIAKAGNKNASGETEVDALVALAKKMNVMIWSEMLWKKGKIEA